MRIKIILFFLLFWTLAACDNDSSVLPTLMPTAQLESPPTAVLSLPATNTPVSPAPTIDGAPAVATNESDEAEAVIEEIDREVCEQAATAQAELADRQAQGKDVAELATAVAELMAELDNCEILLTPTPFN